MVDLNSFKKADLLDAARKVGVSVNSKDVKKLLVEKLEAYVAEAGAEGELLVAAALDADDVADVDDDSTLAEEPDKTEDEDEEYKGPPIDVLKFFDPVIDFTEEYRTKFLDFTDSIGATVLDYSDDLRENLSKTITLNYLELLLEFNYFLYSSVPLVAAKDNAMIHPILKEYIPILSKWSFKFPDLTYLVQFKTLSIAFNWSVYAIVLPLIISYYFNFTKRSIVLEFDNEEDDDEEDEIAILVRAYKYDPFIFALAKVLIFYFVCVNSGTLVTLSSFRGLFKALETHFLIQLGFIKEFYLTLGNFPLVLGLANLVIGIYSQFEEY